MQQTLDYSAQLFRERGVVAVPARLASTRLPNKLLLDSTGMPLLAHVLMQCQKAIRISGGLLTDVILACDDSRLLAVAERAGVRAILTSRDHRCGTTRIAEAVERMGLPDDVTFVVNVQGDEPELAPEAIIEVSRSLLAAPESSMATLVLAMPTTAGKENPNVVKAVLDQSGRAITFSRAPVPYDRTPPGPDEAAWYHHLGIYAYRRTFLTEFARMPSSPLEEREGLEQLRAIEAGHRIQAKAVPHHWAGKGIDTPEDYAAFVARVGGRLATNAAGRADAA